MRPYGILIALGLVGLGLGAFALQLASNYEVLEQGQILPYTTGHIYKIRFGGWLTLYVEPELRPSFDLVNAYLLAGVAFIALTFAAILRRASRDPRGSQFWFFVVSFFGVSYLVADELLGIHETLGHNLQFLAGLPIVRRPDDVIMVLFAAPAALVLWLFRSVILASRSATLLFGISFACFGLAALADVFSLPLEEPLEVFATGWSVLAMIRLGLHYTPPGSLEHGAG